MIEPLARDWHKSSRSAQNGGCVEHAVGTSGTHYVRDTKQHGQGPVLEFTPAEWKAFVGGVKGGEFD